MMYETCPKQLHFAYVLKIPWDDHDFFQIWKDTETLLFEMLEWKEDKAIEKYWVEIVKLANAIYENTKFQELISWKKLQYQTKYEDEDTLWYSDLETPEIVIDIKTSSTKWNTDTVRKYRFQALHYLKKSWKKEFYFVVVNKKTYEVQVIKVTPKDFSELEAKIREVKLAFEMWIFPATPGFQCKMCSYNNLCDKQ